MPKHFTKIPKQVFFFWGDGPLPYLNLLSVISFKKKNPGWKVFYVAPRKGSLREMTWDTHEQKNIYKGRDWGHTLVEAVDEIITVDFTKYGLPEKMNIVHQADAARQILMYERGGLWSDMDVLYLKSVEEIKVNSGADVVLCWGGPKRKNFFSTGVVMASPRNEYYHKIVHGLSKFYNPKEYQSVGPGLLREIYPNMDNVVLDNPDLQIDNMSYNTFYEYPYNALQRLYKKRENIPSHVVGVHWFGGATESMNFRNGFNRRFNLSPDGMTIEKVIINALN